MVCLYILFIQVVFWLRFLRGLGLIPNFTVILRMWLLRVGVLSTGAFERFMSGCVEGGLLVFPERNIEGFEVEARVLVDWLRKGKRFYRSESGVEVNIAGRLVGLLVKVRDSELRGAMEEVLKESVTVQE